MATSTAMAEDTSFEEDQLASMTPDDIPRASRLLANEIRILKVTTLSLLSIFFETATWNYSIFPHSKFTNYLKFD